MRERVQRWAAHLTTPVDAASLGIFRIVFGLMIAWDSVRYLQYGWIDEYYVRPKIHFTYLFFDFVRPWPEAWMMHLHFWLIALLGVLVGVGLFYRAAVVLLFLAYAYKFLLEKSVYMNHYYLIALLAFLLCWMPAERAFSLDRRRRAERPQTVPRWCVLLLRTQLFIVYFYGAIAKLNPDWLAGEPMYTYLVRGGPQIPAIASHFPPALLAYAIAYGGILTDMCVPLLLVFRRTVPIGFAFAVVFHVLNEIFLQIGVFSYLMIGAITIFFSPDWPRHLQQRVSGRPYSAPPLPPGSHRTPWATLAFLHLYVLGQLLFPLRHLLYPGRVSWTEEGHRFAWHMKLRKKESRITIHVFDPATGRRWTIDPKADLIPRQLRKLNTFPDILLQYVHYERDQLRAEGIADPVITVDWLCSLNGAPWARLVDPTVNLAEVESTWRHASWLLPQEEPGKGRDRPAPPDAR